MSHLISARSSDTSISEMTTEEFLCLLKERHVEVQIQGGRLKTNAPAGVVNPLLRAELKARKMALLHALREKATGAAGDAGLAALGRAAFGRVPVTPAQQGMWLIDHFNPGHVAYNIPEAFRLDRPMELETMQAAVDKLVARHSILRTSVHEEDGELFQSIAESTEARVGFTDFASLSEAEGERRCRESVRNEVGKRFDLNQAPLVRFHLYRLAERRHVVFFSIHHIIADRTSLYLLSEELVAFIDAIQNGKDPILPAIDLHFSDYAAWVAGQMKSDRTEGQIAYWKRKLDGMPAFIDLPHNRPRPEVRSSSGASRRLIFPEAARAAIERIGTEEGASPFMTFLAVFAVSVARWAQHDQAVPVDFCIGSPITHRRESATERMIGLFVNMLAFRCQIGPGMSFRDVVRQVRGTALEAYENSDVPFQRLVRAINPDRRSLRSPIFQVMFGYERYIAPVANEFETDAESGTARYDLSLHIWETADGGLMGAIEYSTDLFEEADIDRLGIHGDALLAEIVRGPDQQVFGPGASPGVPPATEAPKGGPEVEVIPKVESKRGLFSKMGRMLSSIMTDRVLVDLPDQSGTTSMAVEE